MTECLDEWRDEWKDEWMNGWINECRFVERKNISFQIHRTRSRSLEFIYLFIYWRLISSTAQGHLRAFHKFKSYISWIQFKTFSFYKHKTYKHNPKVCPFGIALVKKWQIKLEAAGTIDRSGLAIGKKGRIKQNTKNIHPHPHPPHPPPPPPPHHPHKKCLKKLHWL